jgi:UDP:flavonoid glycosyltransferase YjiC (YdhE family)
LLKECDLFVSMGGDLATGTLMSGVPQLVFPQQYEQYLTARRIEQIGAGLLLGMKAPPAHVGVALSRVLGEPGFLAAARAYARRYPSYSTGEQQRRIVVRVEEIIAAPSRWGEARLAEDILSPTSAVPGATQ